MLADRALSPMLGVALHAVSCASRLSRGVRHEFASKGGVLTKEDTSPVTVADFGVQALVTLFLREHAPADRFRLVAEEEADALSRDPTLLQTVTGLVNQHYPRYGTAVARRWAEADVLDALSQGGDGGGGEGAFWFLDPIDGTRGFVRRRFARRRAMPPRSTRMMSRCLNMGLLGFLAL
jgi:3'(2'), 5'-bisphosphate nucleotidase